MQTPKAIKLAAEFSTVSFAEQYTYDPIHRCEFFGQCSLPV